MAQRIKPSGVTAGQKFGRLTVTVAPETQKQSDTCMCQCVCGAVKKFKVHNLIGGLSTSCGCGRKDGWESHNLLGKKFGRITVVGQSFRQGSRRVWPCVCECGATFTVKTDKLLRGHTRSCGCLQRDVVAERSTTHGESRDGKLSLRLSLLFRAKKRAAEKKVPFELCLADIEVPEVCPLLGLTLARPKRGEYSPGCASIDEITPGLGYVKGNVQVISYRANTVKSDATIEELERLVKNLKLQRDRLSERARVKRDATVGPHENYNCEINICVDPGGEIGGAVSSKWGSYGITPVC